MTNHANATSSPRVWPLAPNMIHHQYLGGAKIRELRSLEGGDPQQPEEWVGSTTTLLHDGTRGPARLVDGVEVRELLAQAPELWLGPERYQTDGDSGVLLKLLDAGQRLPVHAHPDRAFARAHLASAYGKTEAWLVLNGEPGAAVYVGWNRDIELAELVEHREIQDSDWMLDRMNRVEVEQGMSIVIPAGTIHAIDEGLFIAEIQEPTDFSIVVEWSATTLDRDSSNLGLGWDVAQTAINLSAMPAEELQTLIVRTGLGLGPSGVRSLLAGHADSYFRLQEVIARPGDDAIVPAGFGVVLVLSGRGRISSDTTTAAVEAGQTYVIPFALGDWRLSGDADLLIAQPGLPGSASDPEGNVH